MPTPLVTDMGSSVISSWLPSIVGDSARLRLDINIERYEGNREIFENIFPTVFKLCILKRDVVNY